MFPIVMLFTILKAILIIIYKFFNAITIIFRGYLSEYCDSDGDFNSIDINIKKDNK